MVIGQRDVQSVQINISQQLLADFFDGLDIDGPQTINPNLSGEPLTFLSSQNVPFVEKSKWNGRIAMEFREQNYAPTGWTFSILDMSVPVATSSGQNINFAQDIP